MTMSPVWNDGRRFIDRVALVTGGGGTLGGAIARALGREGARVSVGYRNALDAAEAVVGDILAEGRDAFAAKVDVTDADSVASFVATTKERWEEPHILVNAAGRLEASDTSRFSDMSLDDSRALLEVDVLGTMRMCQQFLAASSAAGGAILNIASTYGNGVNPDNPINFVPVGYCAAKGAVRGMTVSLARELAPNIRVNALAPGPISGQWEQEWDVSGGQVQEALNMIPLRRFGRPEE
ncbi:MAG: SDR family oxidoreductase, partial [Candidatus Nanopelagicales bacterium]